MNDPRTLRANERYKAASAALYQLGSALLAAAVVKMYLEVSFSWEGLSWLSLSVALIWSGWVLLGLLEPEMHDDTDRA